MATTVRQCMATSSFQYQNLDSISMAVAVLHTWQTLLPIHGNQYILASKLLYSRLELTRQMRSTISAAHMLLAIGKSRRQYMSHCTRPLVSVFCLIFSTITATNLLFLTCYSHKNKCSAVFVVQISLPCCAACAHLVWSVTPN